MLNTACNIDALGFCSALGGWLLLGWDGQQTGCEAPLNFGNRTVIAEPITFVYERSDVREIGTGIVIFISDQRDLHGMPQDLTLRCGDYTFYSVLNSAQRLEQRAQIAHACSLIAHAVRSEQWKTLVTMLDRPIFAGADIIDSFELPVFLHLDDVFICPPHRLWIFGWTLDPFSIVKTIALRCGSRQLTTLYDQIG